MARKQAQISLSLFGQGHFQHSPQLAARVHPRRPGEADRTVRPPAEDASSHAALHQTPAGQPDLPSTLLRLQGNYQEQVSVPEQVFCMITGIIQNY